MKEVIVTANAPKPSGPYSHAVRFSNLLFVSGQTGRDGRTGALVSGGAAGQTEKAIENIRQILLASGSDLSKVLKTTVFLMDLNDFAAVNQAYAKYFDSEPPARSTLQVAMLPGNALVEIEAIASL